MSKQLLIAIPRNENVHYGVPVGNRYVFGKEPFFYRWVRDEDGFQIYLDGDWQDAQSCDWEFPHSIDITNEIINKALEPILGGI